MIRPMACSPWSDTPLWNTIPVIADEAMDPTYPNVRSRLEAVPSWSAGPERWHLGMVPPGGGGLA